MSKFDLKINKNGDVAQVKISGVIDEDADFTLHPLSGMTNIAIDLNDIKSINSCGIREWIKWLTPTAGSKVEFLNCPKVMVDQMNMVDGFLPSHGIVKSFYVPYFNEDSGSEKNILFSLGKEFNSGQVTPPSNIKDEDGNEMEMDVIEAKYFKFLKR